MLEAGGGQATELLVENFVPTLAMGKLLAEVAHNVGHQARGVLLAAPD